MAEHLSRLHLERSKGTRDQTPLHTIRTEANSGRSIKGISGTKKILETETGRPNVPTTHQNKNGHPVHSGIQAHE
jgi:hypothetical protein